MYSEKSFNGNIQEFFTHRNQTMPGSIYNNDNTHKTTKVFIQ